MAENKIKIVFIGGAGRSGTTLLDRILGQVNGFFSLGEIHHMWERSFIENQLCGCGKPFKECEFWQAVVKEAFGGFEQVDAQHILRLQRSVARIRHTPQLVFPRLRSKEFRSSLREYIETLECLYGAIAKLSGCEVLIDSSKAPPHAFALSEMSNIDLSVIHLVRDSRAVVNSWQRKKRRPEIHWKVEYMPRLGLLKGTQEWILSNWLNGLLRNRVGLYKVVEYDTLAERPKTTVSKILEWLCVKSANLDFFINENWVKLGIDHTVSGNPIRFKQGVMEIRPDREWMEKMPWFKKCLVTALTYSLLRGYRKAGGSEAHSIGEDGDG
ncbi:sulfotransferase [Desulfofundulus thermocisternus]|uniref:sulfotransferase n=1 Tax=Desulfofundulus thermocisternus TaxID=42471 RepID=UPI00217E5180|nr:sulfotransferase [Desulfofundulus thermocisternus]MCS5697196.1 sulfotransferase [Desulfofundulus thermocisternus]